MGIQRHNRTTMPAHARILNPRSRGTASSLSAFSCSPATFRTRFVGLNGNAPQDAWARRAADQGPSEAFGGDRLRITPAGLRALLGRPIPAVAPGSALTLQFRVREYTATVGPPDTPYLASVRASDGLVLLEAAVVVDAAGNGQLVARNAAGGMASAPAAFPAMGGVFTKYHVTVAPGPVFSAWRNGVAVPLGVASPAVPGADAANSVALGSMNGGGGQIMDYDYLAVNLGNDPPTTVYCDEDGVPMR